MACLYPSISPTEQFMFSDVVYKITATLVYVIGLRVMGLKDVHKRNPETFYV